MIGNIIAYLRGYLLRTRVKADGPIKSIGRTIIINKHGTIHIGRRSTIWPDVKLSLTKPTGSRTEPVIRIGTFSSLGDRTQIHCGDRVEIGDHVLVAWDVVIIEYDYHAAGGGMPKPLPIIIEDEVWIGARCIITKGVTIGRGSIVSAGSVVTRSMPPFSLVAGNPARVIRQVRSWRGTGPPASETDKQER